MKKPPASAAGDVERFLAALEHPEKPAILRLHETILAADPAISTEIKWNVPSYRKTEFFATLHLRAKSGVGVILHFGAKKSEISETGVAIPDPASLLRWLAKDRAQIVFRDDADVLAKRAELGKLLRHWIRHVR